MNKIILADSQAIFRAGTAKVLATDEDMRIIAQCTDLDRMHHAITTFPGSIFEARYCPTSAPRPRSIGAKSAKNPGTIFPPATLATGIPFLKAFNT